jgi:uncharacterized DUF497 family protein
MRYRWDSSKARLNLWKHGVEFADAVAAIEDPASIEEVDDEIDYGEERIRTIGASADGVLFVVWILVQADVTRIISARKATKYEVSLYHRER